MPCTEDAESVDPSEEPSADQHTKDRSDQDDDAPKSGSAIEAGDEDPVLKGETREVYPDDGVATSLYIAANQTILNEIKDQHGGTLSTINSLTQRSGILMAFNSVFIMELLGMDSADESLWWITVISILVSMVFGFVTIMTGREAPLGTDIDIVVSTYKNGKYDDLTPTIFRGKRMALKRSKSMAAQMSRMVSLQMLFLAASVFGLVIMEA